MTVTYDPPVDRTPFTEPLVDPTGHEMHLEYSVFDDGIHIVCQCAFSAPLGFWPTPSDVVSAQFRHLGM